MGGLTVSIVIPAWGYNDHARDLARGVAENIRETTTGDYESIMVYAGVDPGNVNVDRLIRIDPPQGWGAASNIGLLHAEGEHLVVGSIDIRVPAGWLPPMLEAAGTDNISSPLDYKPDGVTRRKWDRTMRGSYWGGWFLFHRNILDTIGYLDGYGMRVKADMDWAIRARQAGFRTVRVDVKAMHIEPHHTLQVNTDVYVEPMRQAFQKRHGVERFGEWEGLPK